MTDTTPPREDGPAMKPNGLYVPLDVDFASDDKLCECSVNAEHVFVRSLALCKRTLSDGVVTMSQLRRECEKLDRGEVEAAVLELLSVGLYESIGIDRVVLPSWLKRNPSKAALIDSKVKAEKKSLLGNHTRWHVKENVVDPKCELCMPSSQGISHGESHGESWAGIHKLSEAKSKLSEANHPGTSPEESRNSDDSAEVVAAQIFRNAGFTTKNPSRGEVQTVARALARGWPADYLRNLGTEAAVKADTNPKGYIASALNRCANLELPSATTAPKPPGPLVTCPECGGMARDYGPDGTLVDVDCKRCDNRRKVPLDATADF